MPDPRWVLVGFTERLVEWVGREHPPAWVEERVAHWLPTLALDPFRLARPEPGGGGELFMVEVPDARQGRWSVVCSYWIERRDLVVRCNQISFRDDADTAPDHWGAPSCG